MSLHLSPQRTGNRKHAIAKLFGTAFVVVCLIATALSVALPRFSSAAKGTIAVKASAATSINSAASNPEHQHSSRLEVGDNPRIVTFLRFDLKRLGQNDVAGAHLQLFTIQGSDKPVGLQLYTTDPNWTEHSISWQQQPALGGKVAERAPAPLAKGKMIDFDLSSSVKSNGVNSFALISDSPEHIQFRGGNNKKAPELVITLQANAAPIAADDPAATATSEASNVATDPGATIPSDQVDPATAAADAAETTSDADVDPNAPRVAELQSAVSNDANTTSLAAAQALVTTATPNPMGCQAGDIFIDMQDWWSNPNPSKDHGHLHVSVCFPYMKTLTGKVTFRVRSVMHMNPGSLVRLAIYTTTANVAGTVTCGGNGALACATGLPRTLARCTATGGTVSDNGATCTWWDNLTVNTASVAYDGWQEFRIKGYVNEPDGTKMIVSNGLHAYFKNGHTVKNAISNPSMVTARGWYTDANYTNANMTNLPASPVSGIWKPYVIFNAPSGAPITGYYAALDTDFHHQVPGIPIKSGTSAWKGNLVIDTTKLSNGWHRLFLKSDAYMKSSGSTNSGVLAILFEVKN